MGVKSKAAIRGGIRVKLAGGMGVSAAGLHQAACEAARGGVWPGGGVCEGG
jgi:hypothetical protein